MPETTRSEGQVASHLQRRGAAREMENDPGRPSEDPQRQTGGCQRIDQGKAPGPLTFISGSMPRAWGVPCGVPVRRLTQIQIRKTGTQNSGRSTTQLRAVPDANSNARPEGAAHRGYTRTTTQGIHNTNIRNAKNTLVFQVVADGGQQLHPNTAQVIKVVGKSPADSRIVAPIVVDKTFRGLHFCPVFHLAAATFTICCRERVLKRPAAPAIVIRRNSPY